MVYEGVESCEQRVVALDVESVDEILLGALSPVSDRAGEATSLVGRIEGAPTGVARILAWLAEPCGAEGFRDALDVHRVGPEVAGEAPDAAAGLGGDETEQGRLRGGQLEVGEIGLPCPPPRPVCHAEKEPDTVGGHLGVLRWSTRSPCSARRLPGGHATRLVAQASTTTSGASPVGSLAWSGWRRR